MKSVQTVSFQNLEGNGDWRVEPPVDVACDGLAVGPDTGSTEFRIAGLIGPVSPSDPECFDGDHDHIKCGSQEIVGKKNVRSDGSNGLLRRADQTDFFTDYTLTVQQSAALFQKSGTGRRPAGLSVQGSFARCSPLYFTDHTLTGKLAAFPWLGSDTARRFRRPAVRNAFVRIGACHLYFTSRTLSRS